MRGAPRLIRRHFLFIETQIGEGSVDVAMLDELFRSFHTIKGISGMVGLGAVEQLAHTIEEMLRSAAGRTDFQC